MTLVLQKRPYDEVREEEEADVGFGPPGTRACKMAKRVAVSAAAWAMGECEARGPLACPPVSRSAPLGGVAPHHGGALCAGAAHAFEGPLQRSGAVMAVFGTHVLGRDSFVYCDDPARGDLLDGASEVRRKGRASGEFY